MDAATSTGVRLFPRATLLETDESLWRWVLDTNLTGAFFACRAIVPHMAAREGGAIITIDPSPE